MNILGLSCFYHDSAAALVVDGEVRSAAAEERFSRRKHDNNFPLLASEYCLSSNGRTIYDVDLIAYYDKPILKFERALFTHLKHFPRSFGAFLTFMPGWLSRGLSVPNHIKTNLSADAPVNYVHHHESHAASAFYPSPFERALILTTDGVGDWATTSWGIGENHTIETKQEIAFPHSLGLLYSTITTYLGFSANGGEGKVMGLAPYGKPTYREQFSKLIHVFDDGSFKLDSSYFSYSWSTRMFSSKLIKLLGAPRVPESDFEERHYDIAATLQAVLEETLIKMVRHLTDETGIKNLCLAGGVALNCVANGKILENTDIEGLYIQPAAGDDGGALGAALFAHHQILGNEERKRPKDYYLGPDYSLTYVRSFLKRQAESIDWEELQEDELCKRTAEYINDDKIIAWFQGRMEFGPRALGNRSILATPKNPDMKDILNYRVKKREGFRPFAPSVIEKHAHEYFEMKNDSPYMLVAAAVKEDKRSEVPAINHVDNTARVQTVSPENNPRYHKLLEALGASSGTPVVLNTSFNLRGEPIVCTPEDALSCFLRTDIDVLVINDFWVTKKDGSVS